MHAFNHTIISLRDCATFKSYIWTLSQAEQSIFRCNNMVIRSLWDELYNDISPRGYLEGRLLYIWIREESNWCRLFSDHGIDNENGRYAVWWLLWWSLAAIILSYLAATGVEALKNPHHLNSWQAFLNSDLASVSEVSYSEMVLGEKRCTSARGNACVRRSVCVDFIATDLKIYHFCQLYFRFNSSLYEVGMLFMLLYPNYLRLDKKPRSWVSQRSTTP